MSHSGTALIDPYKVFEKISLAPGMRVADLGCGRTGHFVFPASRVVGTKGVVYAVEIVKDILESIKSRVRSEGYDNVQALWSNIELVGKTPIPDNSLDACFFVNVLFLVNDKKAALEEAVRMVKSGGTIVVVEWGRKLGPLGPKEDQWVEPGQILAWANDMPLDMVDNFSVGEYHYCVLLQKQ